MNKAEEYFKEACANFEKSRKMYDEPFFVEAIRKAQKDAIDCTIAKILDRKKADFFLTNEAIIEEQKKLLEGL